MRSGYKVLTTPNQQEALQLARRFPPDLILSDVCMPEGSGYDLIAAVKSDPLLKGIPFVFITSTAASENDRKKGLALGAAKFLFRPIEPQDLLSEVEACLPSAKGA
jgi:CheY-like chemotaxis protein